MLAESVVPPTASSIPTSLQDSDAAIEVVNVSAAAAIEQVDLNVAVADVGLGSNGIAGASARFKTRLGCNAGSPQPQPQACGATSCHHAHLCVFDVAVPCLPFAVSHKLSD